LDRHVVPKLGSRLAVSIKRRHRAHSCSNRHRTSLCRKPTIGNCAQDVQLGEGCRTRSSNTR
jgi:hypothetical protein